MRKKTALEVTEAVVSNEQLSKEQMHLGTWRILGAACVGSTLDTAGGKPPLTEHWGGLAVCLLCSACLSCLDFLLTLSRDLSRRAEVTNSKRNKPFLKGLQNGRRGWLEGWWWEQMLPSNWCHKIETTGNCTCEKIVLKKQDGCGLLWASVFPEVEEQNPI